MLDIAIIGAGPVGLASAAALHQKLGADVKMQVLQIGAAESARHNSIAV